jgi:Raf kinase inhibitor-like YbhB/YbcL family protein
MAFRIFSSAFAEGGSIPRLHSCEGADVSPSLEWSGAPRNTESFALLVEDPDAPRGTWTHWLLWDVPPGIHTLSQGAVGVGVAGSNDFGRPGYGGRLPANARRAEFDAAIAGKVVGEAVCMGRFRR